MVELPGVTTSLDVTAYDSLINSYFGGTAQAAGTGFAGDALRQGSAAGAQFYGDHVVAGIGQRGGAVPGAGAELQHTEGPRAAEAFDRGPAALVHSRRLRVVAPPLRRLVVEVRDPLARVAAGGEKGVTAHRQPPADAARCPVRGGGNIGTRRPAP